MSDQSLKLLWERSKNGEPLQPDQQPVAEVVIRITDEFILNNESDYVVYDSRRTGSSASANQRKIKDVFTGLNIIAPIIDSQFIDLNIEVILTLPANNLEQYLAANFGLSSDVQQPMLDLDYDELRAMSGNDIYEPRVSNAGSAKAAASISLNRIESRIQSRAQS